MSDGGQQTSGPVEEKGVHYYIIIPAPAEDGTVSSNNGGKARQARIGIKRYAGLYCRKCHISVLKEGEESARYAGKVHADRCALCGTPTSSGIVGSGNSSSSNASVISECNCFDWHMAPHRLQQCFASNKVIDSYGTTFEVPFFLEKLVGTCPIQFYDKIEHSNK